MAFATITSDIDLVFKELNDEVYDIIKEEVVNLHNDLIDVGEAVRDTGNFKNSFAPIQNSSRWTWSIDNDAHSEEGYYYASLLARGRLKVGGKWYGSKAWSKGLTPMLRKTNRTIEERADKILL